MKTLQENYRPISFMDIDAKMFFIGTQTCGVCMSKAAFPLQRQSWAAATETLAYFTSCAYQKNC